MAVGLLRRVRDYRAQRRWNATASRAEAWEEALRFLHPPWALVHINRVRQNARRGQKVYLQQALPRGDRSWAVDPEEAAWIWWHHYAPGTWLAINNGDRRPGEHHRERVLYIEEIHLAVPDQARAAWQYIQDHKSRVDPQ